MNAERVVAAARARIRPVGLSPGAPVMIGAWAACGLIARLTGSPAVVTIMAGVLVAAVVDAVAGWLQLRRVAVTSVTGPDVTTVGAATSVEVDVETGPHGRRRDWLLGIAPAGLAPIATAVMPPNRRPRDAGDDGPAAQGDGPWALQARFERAGVIDRMVVTVEAAGPFGLTRWRCSVPQDVAPVHVAPEPVGPLLPLIRAAGPEDGLTEAPGARHVGDVDGVRPWRDGDPIGSVHWSSTLRAGDLIVHDRVAVSDEVWAIDLDAARAAEAGPARLRWTIDEGRRLGHVVAVVDADERHRVLTGHDAARWSARLVPTAPPQRRSVGAAMRREVSLTASEPLTTVGVPARWAVAVAAAVAVGMLVGAIGWPVAVSALAAAGLAAGAAASLAIARRWPTRPRVLQGAVALAAAAALAFVAYQHRDTAGLLAVLRGPMPDLLILLVVLHGFEVLDRRTLRVHQAITVVVVAYAAGLRIDGVLGWWLIAWGVAFVTALLLTTVVDTAPVRPAPATGVRSPLRPVAAAVCGIAAAVGLLAVVPIPDGPARLGLPAFSDDGVPVSRTGALVGADGAPASPTTNRAGAAGAIGAIAGYPGFSDTLDTSVRGDLGDDVVMRVRAPEPAFWRGQTFVRFDGRVWTATPGTTTELFGSPADVPPTLGDVLGPEVETSELIQTFHVEQDLPNLLFAASRPVQVIVDGEVSQRPDGALLADVTLTEGSVYTVVSDRVLVDAERLRAQGDVSETFAPFLARTEGRVIAPFLELPPSTTERTIELAASLRRATTYDTILAYEEWLAATTEYDLDAPVPDGDAVDDFLFRTRLGYCEQIASALTVMLRSQGVPARLATGYLPGERDRVSGVWTVRARDAHAWVEVWFPDTGWQPFDPTASVPLSADASAGTIGGDLVGAAFDSVRSRPVPLAIGAIAVAALWAAFRSLREVRRRRRRGRWGLLQDRFDALVPASSTPAAPTNRARAEVLADRTGDPHRALDVAASLDRAAFDPAWVDDDAEYERTRVGIGSLER